ncbi:MAG: hypothetical protein ACOC5B_00575 [Myxococcota bacterium]
MRRARRDGHDLRRGGAARKLPRDRTRTEAEIEAVSQKIIAQVTRATGATLRG